MRIVGVVVIGGLGRSLLGLRELVSPKIQGLPLVERGLGVLASIGIEERLLLLASEQLENFEVPSGACAIAFDAGESPRDRLHGLAALAEGAEVIFLLLSDGSAATPARLWALLEALSEGAELAYLSATLDGRSAESAPSAMALSSVTLERALRGWGQGSPGSLVDWAKASELEVRCCEDEASLEPPISRSAQ